MEFGPEEKLCRRILIKHNRKYPIVVGGTRQGLRKESMEVGKQSRPNTAGQLGKQSGPLNACPCLDFGLERRRLACLLVNVVP